MVTFVPLHWKGNVGAPSLVLLVHVRDVQVRNHHKVNANTDTNKDTDDTNPAYANKAQKYS